MSGRAFGEAGIFRARVFWMPKGGSSAEEYEDAFAVSEERAAGAPFRAAVADGATEAAFARRWARLLADGFAEHGPAAVRSHDEWPALQEKWRASVAAQAEALPWYGAEKAAAGAFAALLGLELFPETGPPDLPSSGPTGGAWRAVSVGDANLFHLRDGETVRAWPREDPEDFGSRPALLPSRADAETPTLRRTEGRYQPGDAFALATDAAAAWLLRCETSAPGARTDPARALTWDDEAAFAEAVRAARDEGALDNDDTTVLCVTRDT
ncbi:MAG: hypothetical protein BRD46_04950 [Bacteroidetes bacterium QS_8_68_15]|nr:MAG: hypothetical protein BRD46_04950 [Bacteroidetes bacterium QS_8_68_15]